MEGWSKQAWAVGVVYACMTVLYVTATKLTTSANAIFLQSTGPLYLLLLGPYVLRERIRPSDLAYLGALAGGLAICFAGRPVATAIAPDPATVTKAVRHLPAFEMSLLLLLEPVLNPIWTWLIWKEYPGALVLFGGAVIVVATGIKSVYDARAVTLTTQTTKTG